MRARLVATAAAAAMVGALLSASPALASPVACSSDSETLQLRTFQLELKMKQKVYKVGETVKILVEVRRPANEDPLGLGVPLDPPQTFPAENVGVGVGLNIKRVFLPGFAETDENGKAVVEIKIERWVSPGWADVDGYAWEKQLETPCLSVEENGYKHEPKFFRVTR